jgi:hypothetical protein
MRLASLFSVSAISIVTVSLAGSAFAADDEEGGEKKAKPVAAAPAATTTTTTTTTDTTTDHDKVNGRVGVGYLGQVTVPLGGGGGSQNAQIIGIRYWTSPTLAIVAGLGFGSTSGSTKTVAGNTTTTKDDPSATAFALKGGVALPLATGHHYTFVLEPQLVIGYATQTVKTDGAPNQENSGYSVGIGATAGAEIQFGFMGIPELSLVGSVGLAFQTASGKTKVDTNEQSFTKTSISTFTLSNPWNIFAGNVAAIYYF